MGNESPDESTEQILGAATEVRRALADLTVAIRESAAALAGAGHVHASAPPFPELPTFPLDKRECFAALALMGLTSRLQPVHATNLDGKKMVVALAFEMADLAIAKTEERG